MVKLGWIVLTLVVMVVLVESTASSPTTRKPRSRKASLSSRSLSSGSSSSSSSSSSASSSSSKRSRPSSSTSSRRVSSRTSGAVASSGGSSSSSRRSSSSSSRGGQSSSSNSRGSSYVIAVANSASLEASSNQLPQNTTYGVRRNPASLSVNPGRLREDMNELGLEPESEDDFNNVDVMEAVNYGRQQATMTASRSSAYSPYSDYEDMLFDEYDQPLQDNKLLAETSSSSSGKFLKSEVCGRKFFCQRGNRGPCHRNEVFVPQVNDSSLVITRPSCGNLISYPWNGCLSAGKVGVSATNTAASGSCAIRFPQRPCYGYPPNYRYCGQTKRCYAGSNGWDSGIISSGPCPLNKVFIDIDGINGMCQCRDRNQLLFKGDDRCHRIYAKGPCPRGQWLEPDTNGYGICRPSPCPENKCDGRHIYWKSTPNAEGGCYKSFTRGPCRRNSYFLVEDYGTRRGRCVSQYGSSFSPINPYALPPRYPMNRNSFDMMYSNSLMSPWSKFGMFPPFGMQDTMDFEDDYDELPNIDY